MAAVRLKRRELLREQESREQNFSYLAQKTGDQ
jgi:hypothetical protein